MLEISQVKLIHIYMIVMKNRLKQKYEALGFVEALMAIMVVGISSVVLMQIAVNTIQNTIQNETIDIMTQYAVEGAEMAQDIANKEAIDEDDFPDSDGCYIPERVYREEEVSEERAIIGATFRREEGGAFISYTDENQRDLYKEGAKITEEDEFFRIICLEFSELPEKSFVVGKVIVGQTNSEGNITKGNLVKDYEYLTVIKL